MVAPSSFRGEVGCSDCGRLKATLTLRADGLFLLRSVDRSEPQRPGRAVVSLGVWETPETGELVLKSELEPAQYFQQLPEHRLRLLRQRSLPVRAALPDELRLLPEVDAFSEPFAMRGLVVYLEGTGRFKECASGRTWPIAAEAAAAERARAYSARPAIAGEPRLVTIEARFAQRTARSGERTEEVVIVDRNDGIGDGRDCARSP
jgi:hypothetical protein